MTVRWSLRCFPDWEWYRVRICETPALHHFWAKCDDHGTIRFRGHPEGRYENHFLHSLRTGRRPDHHPRS
ncbi:PhzA/PhzB family protein [Streptomyces sp. NPDC059477]|uniref:PhzA/PhzB family protein n=1 Tax=Streptomyces sp. NPDC059477 TaxID=3346847 RepID=UPI003693F091